MQVKESFFSPFIVLSVSLKTFTPFILSSRLFLYLTCHRWWALWMWASWHFCVLGSRLELVLSGFVCLGSVIECVLWTSLSTLLNLIYSFVRYGMGIFKENIYKVEKLFTFRVAFSNGHLKNGLLKLFPL